LTTRTTENDQRSTATRSQRNRRGHYACDVRFGGNKKVCEFTTGIPTHGDTKLQATDTRLLSTRALSKGAREAIVVPGMSQPALMSVSTLTNYGYTTVFLPVDIFRADDVIISSTAPPAPQGWRDGRGLWMVPVVDDTAISHGLDIAETAMGVHKLPSTKEVVRFLHAALGNPTQATLLTAAQHGNLVTFPGMTPQNISRHFPKSDETQKGHMKQTKQGVRSTKSQTQRCVPYGFQCHQEIDVHRSNGTISHHVGTRQQVYHGCG
jgi:hypothetical protein